MPNNISYFPARLGKREESRRPGKGSGASVSRYLNFSSNRLAEREARRSCETRPNRLIKS